MSVSPGAQETDQVVGGFVGKGQAFHLSFGFHLGQGSR